MSLRAAGSTCDVGARWFLTPRMRTLRRGGVRTHGTRSALRSEPTTRPARRSEDIHAIADRSIQRHRSSATRVCGYPPAHAPHARAAFLLGRIHLRNDAARTRVRGRRRLPRRLRVHLVRGGVSCLRSGQRRGVSAVRLDRNGDVLRDRGGSVHGGCGLRRWPRVRALHRRSVRRRHRVPRRRSELRVGARRLRDRRRNAVRSSVDRIV